MLINIISCMPIVAVIVFIMDIVNDVTNQTEKDDFKMKLTETGFVGFLAKVEEVRQGFIEDKKDSGWNFKESNTQYGCYFQHTFYNKFFATVILLDDETKEITLNHHNRTMVANLNDLFNEMQ